MTEMVKVQEDHVEGSPKPSSSGWDVVVGDVVNDVVDQGPKTPRPAPTSTPASTSAEKARTLLTPQASEQSPAAPRRLGVMFLKTLTLLVALCGVAWQVKLERDACSSVDVLEKDALFQCSSGWFGGLMRLMGLMECDEVALRSHLRSRNATVMDDTGFKHFLTEWRVRGRFPMELGKAEWLYGYPSDCEGKWSDWIACSTSCGSGRRCSYFSIQQHALHGGNSCRVADGAENCSECNTLPCPKDCQLGPWEMEPCSELCGGGTQKQSRQVILENQFGGFCPLPDSTERVQTIPCNTHPCPDAVLQEIGEAISLQTVIENDSTRQVEVLQQTKHKLLDHLTTVKCTAGMDSKQQEATASCHEHNAIASKSQELALLLEIGHDECELAAAHFHVLRDTLKHNLPHIVKQICGGDREGANNTFSGLVEPVIEETVKLFNRCREPYKQFGTELVGVKANVKSLHFNAKARSNSLLHEVKKATMGKEGTLGEIAALAEDMTANSKKRDDAYQAQQAKEHELNNFRRSSAETLQSKRDQAWAAQERARREIEIVCRGMNVLMPRFFINFLTTNT